MSVFGSHVIAHGDVLATLRELPDNEFDALLCDPPYGWSFMGRKWDYDVPSVDVWREALRVLKPGAPLLSFGGARTMHRICVGIEDAGFEIRDCLMWLYGKGFPKSQNIGLAIDKAAGATREVVAQGRRKATGRLAQGEGGYAIDKAAGATREVVAQGRRKATGRLAQGEGGYAFAEDYAVTAPATELAQQWDGYGTALKPAWEPVILARKPLIGTMAENVAAHGVGGLAIDACRIAREDGDATVWGGRRGTGANVAMSGANYGGPKNEVFDDGRWPANLILDEHAAELLDASVAPTKSPKTSYQVARSTLTPGAVGLAPRAATETIQGYGDSGGPSRFFYCAKVSTKEREFGCDARQAKSAGEVTDREDDSAGLSSPRAGAGRTGGARNHHPTLKPLSLARWLAALIEPPTEGATLLIPYSGAGSEIIGALQAGWPFVFGIEGDAEYLQIAEARIAAWGKKAA